MFLAFGGRTLHVDIVRKEEDWQWRSAVCYRSLYYHGRDPSFLTYGIRMPPMQDVWIVVAHDDCLWCTYDMHEGKPVPEDANVNIMGFLLSCRQAYTEGIDVLYSNNCINLRSEPLLLHLPQIIPPNRLASITALELIIRAHPIGDDTYQKPWNLDHLKPILNNIATHCHRLRSLVLSFMVASRAKGGHEILDGPAMSWVDAFYRSKPLRNMKVELPFETIHSDQRLPWSHPVHPRETPPKSYFATSEWRCLDGEQPTLQRRNAERYPFPPLKMPVPDDGDESVESAGYWLVEGDPGPMNPIRVGCGAH